jgi:hypothetical protein
MAWTPVMEEGKHEKGRSMAVTNHLISSSVQYGEQQSLDNNTEEQKRPSS